MTKQDQQSCRGFPEAWGLYSSDQILIGQPLAGRAVNEAVNALRGMPLDVAFIETEGELIDVAMRMLRADMVERAVNATLENSEEAFDAVRRDVIANELGGPVIYRLVGKSGKAAVGRELIGMDSRAGFDMLADFIMDHVAIGRLDWHCDRAATALAHSENSRLADCATPGVQLLVSVLIGFLSADIGLVDLDDTSQLFELVAASLAESPENEPCGFLGNADLLGKLHRRDALARSDDEVHRVNPFV